MNKFGVVKTKLLTKLTESYAKENKAEIKELLTTIQKNKDFKELYLFYEEIENKYIEDKETAKLYVDGIESLLKESTKKEFTKFCNNIEQKLGEVKIDKNNLYESLDCLSEKDTLSNIENKIVAKKDILEHLTRKKEIKEINKVVFTENERLLHTVLTNNFNITYASNLNENQKEELKNILSISSKDLEQKIIDLKENLCNTIDSMLVESKDDDFKSKLNKVKEEVKSKEVSRMNYYRLTELKNGLI